MDETGTALFLLGLFSGNKLGFAVLLAVFATEADTSFAHDADGRAAVVAGPKTVAGKQLRNGGRGKGVVCACVRRQISHLSSLGKH